MKTYILIILAFIFWSGNFIFGRFVHDDIDALQLALFRWGGVAIVLLPYMYVRRKPILKALQRHFFILLLLSMFGVTLFNTLLYFGLDSTTATNSLLINSFVPILIIILNGLINKEKITFIQLIGIIVSTLGVFFVIAQEDLSNLINLKFNRGDLLIIMASLAWAFYSIFLRYKPNFLEPFEFISIISLLGFFILAIIYFSTGHIININSFDLSGTVYASILYMIIFPSLLSYYLWNRGVDEIGANNAGHFTHVMPISGSLLAFIFLKESLELYHLYGIIFIGLGIYISLFYKQKI